VTKDERGPLLWLAAAVPIALAVVLAASAWFVSRQPLGVAHHARTELGIFEQLANVFYGLAFLLCMVITVAGRWRKGFYAAVVILALALRELDFQLRFTQTNTTSVRYWLSGTVPLLEKLMVAGVFAGILFAIVMLLRGSIPEIRDALHKRRAWVFSVAGIFALLAVSQLVDQLIPPRIIRKLEQISEGNRTTLFLSLLEESFELGIPILICTALLQGSYGFRLEKRRHAAMAPLATSRPPSASQYTHSAFTKPSQLTRGGSLRFPAFCTSLHPVP
jgi:hypothetical protein